jgi:uncharacterized membrane protein YqaE (UPF0057 family)
MKKIKQISFIALAVTFILSSCTVERRLHNSGYHIKWNKSHSASETEVSANEVKIVKEEVEVSAKNENNEVAINENETSKTVTLDAVEVNESVSVKEKNTSADVSSVETIVAQNKDSKINTHFDHRKAKLEFKKAVKNNSSIDDMEVLLLILCFLIPFVAVGLATDWDITKVLICLILSFLFWIPGIIYALLVVLNKI